MQMDQLCCRHHPLSTWALHAHMELQHPSEAAQSPLDTSQNLQL